MSLAVKRVYEPVAKTDGVRILVDRLWPRGLSKREAHIDLWLRDLAPSTALRKWFGHEPAKWKTFCARYRDELRTQSDWLATVKRKARKGRVTLLCCSMVRGTNGSTKPSRSKPSWIGRIPRAAVAPPRPDPETASHSVFTRS
jgi:uncharacterized protein YeaO (DUF488 family)